MLAIRWKRKVKKMAMRILVCECGNLTVSTDVCEECRDDTSCMPTNRRNGIDRARAFRAGVEVNDYDYVGAN
jgi:hypothetical protein